MLALGGGAIAAAPGQDAIAEAEAAIEKGDGLGAEMAGRRALEEGASRDQVAAYIGEGELLQGQLYDARDWLEDADFDARTRKRGLHALARLELAQGDLPAAAQAFDRLLQSGPADALVWVDIGRMRYLAGEHHGALEAARRAVRLDRQEPRALEFFALLVRDGQGLNAALPLFHDALQIAPEDMGLLGQYAATLGDAGQHGEMLRVARKMLEIDGRDSNAFFMQAVLAARAGQNDLARSLMWHLAPEQQMVPAAIMLTAILEYRSGNYALAAENFDQLVRLQPVNDTARLMFARALLANGEANEVIAMLAARADRPDASNYLLTLIARAHEQLGQRDQAAVYLDRAARMVRPSLAPRPTYLERDPSGRARDGANPVIRIRQSIDEGRMAEAQQASAALLERFPGSIDLGLLSGDVSLLAGDPGTALVRYRHAAQVRNNWPLVQRMVAALVQQGEHIQARRVLAGYLAQNPRDSAAAALLGTMQRDAANPARAALLLRHAAASAPGSLDPLLLSDLAELELVVGDQAQAQLHAQAAHRLQRGNRRVAAALARVYDMRAGQERIAQVLMDKANP
ncbi:hypothetical protein GCM10009127_18620 [Alteraurantiacibacter aestuarii]